MTAENAAWLLTGINIAAATLAVAYAISARRAVARINRRRQQ